MLYYTWSYRSSLFHLNVYVGIKLSIFTHVAGVVECATENTSVSTQINRYQNDQAPALDVSCVRCRACRRSDRPKVFVGPYPGLCLESGEGVCCSFELPKYGEICICFSCSETTTFLLVERKWCRVWQCKEMTLQPIGHLRPFVHKNGSIGLVVNLKLVSSAVRCAFGVEKTFKNV